MTAVHICRGVNRRYVAQIRPTGCRRWITIGEHKNKPRAIRRMAHSFAEGNYKRGRVLLTADYCEPEILVEMVKR